MNFIVGASYKDSLGTIRLIVSNTNYELVTSRPGWENFVFLKKSSTFLESIKNWTLVGDPPKLVPTKCRLELIDE